MSTRAWIAFASVSVLWGIPYLFIKVAVDDGMVPLVDDRREHLVEVGGPGIPTPE